MVTLNALGPSLSATAHERRKQVPVRLLLSGVIVRALITAGHGRWAPAWLTAVAVVHGFEIMAMVRFRRPGWRPGLADICLALSSTIAMAGLFAGMAVVVWTLQGRGYK